MNAVSETKSWFKERQYEGCVVVVVVVGIVDVVVAFVWAGAFATSTCFLKLEPANNTGVGGTGGLLARFEFTVEALRFMTSCVIRLSTSLILFSLLLDCVFEKAFDARPLVLQALAHSSNACVYVLDAHI
eukprot:c8796_g2_i1.p2 GENE.c8796_g2_i1~~c8796_g2_i1.p2  ORF type:complete len:130 (+),score=22.81 c8796_g2_i1:251-640(+)